MRRLSVSWMVVLAVLVLGGPAQAATGPTGSFTLDNGAAIANGFVSVQYQASGPNPVSLVYASNTDQITAQGLLSCATQWPYGETITTFSLLQQACAPSRADGQKTVYVQFVDTQGLLSPVYRQTILLDTTGPVWTQSPRWGFRVPQTVSATSVKMTASWATSDLTQVTSNAQVSVGGDPFVAAPLTSPYATSFDLTTAFKTQLQVRLSPLDAFENYADPATEQASAYPWFFNQTTPAVTRSGGWKLHRSTAYLGGTDTAATAAGATLAYKFSARTVSFVTTTGPTRGKVDIAIDGTPAGTVDLYSATTRDRRVAWSHTFPLNRHHTLTLTVRGTAGRPRVDVDGFLLAT